MTPRRSSRARTTQPSPALLQHSNSSSSGNSLTRGERSTRSHHKIPSPQRSSRHRSQSLDETDSKNDAPHTRQRQRTRDEDNDDPLEAVVDEDDPEEEEITRCLCGQQDYPGLPPSRRDALGRVGIRPGANDETGPTLPTDASDPLSDDLGSMFIQCDSCKVWQHGGCVGIMDEAMSPDEYFCEECRKDLHRITTESNGQHSSQYLPVAAVSSPGSSSRASSRDNSRLSRDPKSHQNETVNNPKRRSTMNSRDAAYDEEEQLRRAIEESKEETRMSHDDALSRRPKRSRSDSESKQAAKRRRTSSPSPSSLSKPSNPVSQPASDDESKAKTNGGAKKQSRVTSARNPRDKDTKEEEAEPERPETATRRKSRSDRRKGDESEQEGGASPTKASAPNDAEPSDPTPGTPVQQAQEPAAPRPSTRKSGRPPARRGGRQGRNQYTRDHVNGEHSPNSAHELGRDSPHGSGHGGSNGVHVNGADSKPSRARHLNPHRTSMNEMKRRVAAILEFISRMQVEMAVSGESSTTPPNSNGNGQAAMVKGVEEQLGALLQATNSETGGASTDSGSSLSVTDGEGPSPPSREKDFKELSSVEMMDVLTRHLLKWQQEYGKYGEK